MVTTDRFGLRSAGRMTATGVLRAFMVLLILGPACAFALEVETENLGNPSGGTGSFLSNQISDRGDIAGHYRVGFDWFAYKIYPDGFLQPLVGLGGVHWNQGYSLDQVTGVNASGTVVGASMAPGVGMPHAVVWKDDALVEDLHGYLPVAQFTSGAAAINDLGVVAFYSRPRPGEPRIWLWHGSTTVAEIPLLPINGSYTLTNAYARAVNNAGAVVGTALDPNFKWVGFYWSESSGTWLIDVADDAYMWIHGFNDLGQVSGTSRSSSGLDRPFIWSQEDGLLWLEPESQTQDCHAVDVNNAGTALGMCDAGYWYGVLWHPDGERMVIGSSTEHFLPRTINDSNLVAGWILSSRQPGLWSAGDGLQTLPIPGKTYGEATDITNSGWVVGRGWNVGEGYGELFRWTVTLPPPTPEEQLLALTDNVESLLDSGTLNAGQADALTDKIAVIGALYDQGNTQAACNVLMAFANQVDAMLRAGVIQQVEWDALHELILAYEPCQGA